MRRRKDRHHVWTITRGEIALSMRLEALLFFATVAVLLDALILPWTLD